MAEQPVVAHPEQPDHGEAEGEPADLGKGVSELPAGLHVGHIGHLEGDDQQGDRDGEDGVAEEHDPVVLELPSSGQDTSVFGRGGHGRECTHPAGTPQARRAVAYLVEALAAEPELDRGQGDHHRRGQHRQRHVDPQQQRTRQRPRGHQPNSGNPATHPGAAATGQPRVGRQPGQVRVSTVVVTSATARRRTVAFCSPNATASRWCTDHAVDEGASRRYRGAVAPLQRPSSRSAPGRARSPRARRVQPG